MAIDITDSSLQDAFRPVLVSYDNTVDGGGKYSLIYLDGVPGAKLGGHKVIIRTEIPGEDGQPPIAKEKLPKKYHEQSELTAEVKTGSNKFDFELKSQVGGAKK
jgi:hypothetical protein